MQQPRALSRLLASCFLLSILYLWSTPASAQSIDWEKTHGSAVGGYAVQRLDDGGFIAVGAGGQWPATVGYLIRTDSIGTKVWEKTIGTGNPGVWVMGVKKTADGGFAVVGSKNSMPWLWKYTSDGSESWSRQLMGPFSYGDARAVVTVPDGIVVTGTNSVAGKYNLFVHKFSLAGDSLWSLQQNYKSSAGNGIRQALDGDFLVVGSVNQGSSYDEYFLKVTPTGAIVWEQTYKSNFPQLGDEAHDVSIASDGFLIVGQKAVSTTHVQMDVIKTKLDGTLEWRKQYGNPDYSAINSVRPLTDGFILAGYSGTSQETKGLALRIDKSGSIVAQQELNASYLHYVDQAVPPAKFVVVGGDVSGSKLYLARVDMTPSAQPDTKTYTYNYNNTPRFALKASRGWKAESPGWIKLEAALDTVEINSLLKFAVTSFRIDTTRSSPTSPVQFQLDGYLLAVGPLTAKMSVLGFTSSNGWIDDQGMHFNSPIRDGNNKGLFGSNQAIDQLRPDRYPQALFAIASGTLRLNGLRSCDGTGEKIGYSMKLSNSTITVDPYGIQTEPGVCLSSLQGTYDVLRDSLSLQGYHYSEMYFSDQMRFDGYIKNGELSPLTLKPLNPTEVPLGYDWSAFVRGLSGVYQPWYLTILGTKIPMGWAAFVSGTLRDKDNKFEVDLKNAGILAPGNLYSEETTYRMYKAGDKWHVNGTSPISMEWGKGYTNFVTGDKTGDFYAINKPSSTEFYFAGRGGGEAHTLLNKPTKMQGIARGFVELPPELGIYLAAMGYLNEVTKAMLLQKVVLATALLREDTALVMPIYPGYLLGPLMFDLSKPSNDPKFARAPRYDEILLGILLTHAEFKVRAGEKGHQTVALSQAFEVPANSPAFYIRVSGNDGADATTLTSPTGATITAPTSDTTVQKLVIDQNTYWWIVDKPEAGQWSISSVSAGDSALIHVFKPIPEFSIDAAQQRNTVTVTWTNPSNDSVDLFLDNDMEGLDGLPVARVSGATGTAQITIPSSLTKCEYRVYAMRMYGAQLQTDYSEAAIDNSTGRLAAPAGITASYNATDKTASITWNTAANIAGYAIRLIGNGIDSIVATQFADATSITIPVEDPNGLFVSIMSYDTNGSRSCWSSRVPLGAASVDRAYAKAQTIDAVVLPNPSHNRASLYLRMDEGNDVRITIYDATGRSLSAISGFYPKGEHDVDLHTEELPSGSYVAVIVAGTKTQTRNFVITR